MQAALHVGGGAGDGAGDGAGGGAGDGVGGPQVLHITGQFSRTRLPITTSLHLPAYSVWHDGGSGLPLQTGVVVVMVVLVVVVLVLVVLVVVVEVHGCGPE